MRCKRILWQGYRKRQHQCDKEAIVGGRGVCLKHACPRILVRGKRKGEKCGAEVYDKGVCIRHFRKTYPHLKKRRKPRMK